MEYQGLKRQFDKLQVENVRMKVVIRQLKTENRQLQTRSRKNTLSRRGSHVQRPQHAEQGPGTLLQMPDAFRIQLVEKEHKMAAAAGMREERERAVLHKARSVARRRRAPGSRRRALELEGGAGATPNLNPPLPLLPRPPPLAPPTRRVGRAHPVRPLEPILVKRLHRNAGAEEAGACQQQHHGLLPSVQPAANPQGGGRSEGAQANEDVAWSMDSFGDNMRDFCEDLLLKAKAREPRSKDARELVETVHYQGPGVFEGPCCSKDALGNPRLSHIRTLDTADNQESRLPRLGAQGLLSSGLACKPLPSSEQSSKLPRLRRIQALRRSGSAPQLCHFAVLPPSGERKNKMAVARRAQNLAQNSSAATQTSGVSEIHTTAVLKEDPARPRRVLPLMRTCIPWSQSSDKLSQGPYRQNNLDQEQQRPIPKPLLCLDQSFQLLSTDNWEKKIEGLTFFRRLAQWHSDVLMTRLHDVCVAIVQEVQNLRSLVSRVAVATLGDLFRHLQRAMDADLDWTAMALIHKAGEPTPFIRQEVDSALGHMLRGCTHTRILKALISPRGLRHGIVAVRECTSRHLVALVGTMGAARLLRCNKHVRDKFLQIVRRMAQDASQEVRGCGQKIMAVFGAYQEFQKVFLP